MQRTAENEEPAKGSRPHVRSAHTETTRPQPFDRRAERQMSPVDLSTDLSRSTSLSTATTSYPRAANASAFRPNPVGASKIGAPYEDVILSQNFISVAEGTSGGAGLRSANEPPPATSQSLAAHSGQDETDECRVVLVSLRVLLVLGGAHSLGGGISFTHVSAVLGCSVIAGAAEVIDF